MPARAGRRPGSIREAGALSLPACQIETGLLLERLSGSAALETPISAIYRGADTVWKLRKAVRMTFLDFTALAERERTARREVELGEANAPGLYRDVVPVTRAEDGVALDGSGEVVDWVVRMARVPDGDFLDEVAKAGGLSAALLDGMADAVAALHARAAPSERDVLIGIGRTIDGNHDSALAAGLPAAEVAAWRQVVRAELVDRAGWIVERQQGGFVRRTHGDLHLANLCLWRGAPVAFDALEFSEAMASIDLAYDLAFLLMDLEIQAGRPAANRVLNRYVARTGDTALLAGLPLFLSVRALVRAHVCGHGGQPWEAYLTAARQVLAPVPPVVVAIGGLPGTGKSTLARRLAPLLGRAPGALVLRSDECRKRLFGVAPEQRLPHAAYGTTANAEVSAAIHAGVGIAVEAGHAVIADATFMAMADRLAVAEAAGAVRFCGVWLEAPMAVLEARVAGRTGDASDADAAVLRRLAASDPGPGDWLALDATDPGVFNVLLVHVTKPATMC